MEPTEADEVCHCGLGPEDHKYPGAAEHGFVAQPAPAPGTIEAMYPGFVADMAIACKNGRIKELEAEYNRLQAFKDWMHRYLDAHDIPHHPLGIHGAAGCRIGDRMDYLMVRLRAAESALAEAMPARDDAEEKVAELRKQWAIMARACDNWREWPAEAAGDHDHPDWKAAARAILEREELRSGADRS